MESTDIHPLTEFRHRFDPPLTQEQLAERIGGVTGPTVCKYEARKRLPEIAVVKRIKEKLGIDPALVRPDLAVLFAPPHNDNARRPSRPRRKPARRFGRAA